MTKTNNEILDTEAAAALLSITPHALRGWVKKKWIKATKLPSGKLRFKREEIERILAEEKKKTGDE